MRGHARSTAPNPRPRVPQPSAIIAEELGHGLRLTRRWLGWSVVPLTFFCVAWDSFLIFWYTMALRQGMPWIMVVFPVGHLAVGVGLTYLTLALYVNRTTVDVNDQRLKVRHGPLPWPGKRDIDVTDLDQPYCQQQTSLGRHGSMSFSYNVCAVLKGGRARHPALRPSGRGPGTVRGTDPRGLPRHRGPARWRRSAPTLMCEQDTANRHRLPRAFPARCANKPHCLLSRLRALHAERLPGSCFRSAMCHNRVVFLSKRNHSCQRRGLLMFLEEERLKVPRRGDSWRGKSWS